DLVYTGNTEGFSPDIRDALELYVDESGSKAVIITILYKPEGDQTNTPVKERDRVPFGCLVAEQIGDELAPTDAHARTEVVSRHASTALWNAQEHDRIFMLPVLKLMGSPWRFFRGRTLAKILGVLAAIVGIVLALTFVPWKLTIEGRGSLLPEQRQNTYAPVAGIVVETPVEHGTVVKKGDLIARLDSRELEKERRRLVAEMQAAQSQAGYLTIQAQKARGTGRPEEYNQVEGQLAEAKRKAHGAKEQIEIIEEEINSMSIAAPVTGVVTSWEVKKNLLGRPVEIGQELISIAATEGEWVLEVEVPDDDMGPILRAQSRLEKEIKEGKKKAGSALSAYFVTATDPEHKYVGYVRRIASKAETVEGKHVVKVTVGFSDAVRKDYLSRNQELRPGAEVRARIDCGEARLAYVLLRDVVHVFYESVLFRWPFLR
ncbi:MAG: HlyD family efflux transporter periplasmic adaptor subunit, partial [Isosphaeraceae bacterium]